MPKIKRDYIYCVNCTCPLEEPVYRQVDTGTIFVDFAVCEDCKEALIHMEDPLITFEISGEKLKALLRCKKSKCLMETPKETPL